VIESRKVPGRKRNKAEDAERKYRVRVEGGHIHIGRMSVAVSDLIAAISVAMGPLPVVDLENVETATATVRLTAAEKQKLKTLEKRRGLPEWHLIREALHAYGLI
jgi:hypothetical protein